MSIVIQAAKKAVSDAFSYLRPLKKAVQKAIRQRKMISSDCCIHMYDVVEKFDIVERKHGQKSIESYFKSKEML